MRTTPNASVEYHRDLYRDLDADTAARNRAARAELPCSECGSADGMQRGWTRELLLSVGPVDLLKAFLGNTILFRCQGNNHELYQTCWQCNPNEIIPTGFEALTPEQVAAWLARECTCPDCVRGRETTRTVS